MAALLWLKNKIQLFVDIIKCEDLYFCISMFLLSTSFFIGIWHAFPMIDVIKDETYLVAGVGTAVGNLSIFPPPHTLSYGTLNYLINYFLIGLFLIIASFFLEFNSRNLKIFLVSHPFVLYFIPRILSAIAAVILIVLINKALKVEVDNIKSRFFLIFLLTTNIITVIVFHTGKMWALSTLLVTASFYYLYLSTKKKDNFCVFWSIILAFLAFTNFILNFFALINIPILFWFFRKNKLMIFRVIIYSVIGFSLFGGLTMLDPQGLISLIHDTFTNYRSSAAVITGHNLAVVPSLFLNLKKILILFPLILITLLITTLKSSIKNNPLFWLSVIYLVGYFLLISFVAVWATNMHDYFRYLVPLAPFFIFLISSLDFKFNKFFYWIEFISLIYFVLTLYYLSIPPTYNQAINYIKRELNNQKTIIINNVPELWLPINKKSALLMDKRTCANQCLGALKYNLHNNFNPLVIDREQKLNLVALNDNEVYYIEQTKKEKEGMKLIISFSNNVADNLYYSVDYNMGNYFDWRYLLINNLGKNIYIYKKSKI